MLNLDTRLNFWEGMYRVLACHCRHLLLFAVEATYHIAADHGAFGHLVAIRFLKLVLAFILRNKQAGLNNREKFTDVSLFLFLC